MGSTKSSVAAMGEWLLTRDQASTPDTTGQQPSEIASGVKQSQNEYTRLLETIVVVGGDSNSVAISGSHTLVSSAFAAAVSGLAPEMHFESARMVTHALAA